MTDLEEALAAVNGEKLQTAPADGGAEKSLPAEALAALDTVKPAPDKFPPDSTLVAVTLSRDEETANSRIALVGTHWRSTGLAIAVRGGKVISANPIFGRWTNGEPKISACHYVKCEHCGEIELMPDAVWSAKDAARAAGVKDEDLEDLVGWDILVKWGKCRCGGRWSKAIDYEADMLQEFTNLVRNRVSELNVVNRFIPPAFFTIRSVEETVDLGPEWSWLQDALGRDFKSAVPYAKGQTGPVVVFNPRRWLGWVENHHDTGLFFSEKGKDKQRSSFNPKKVLGL